MPQKCNKKQGQICLNPFEWFEIHPGGQVFACCPAWLKQPLGNLLTDDVADIWNGPTARTLRQTIHDGSFRHCNRMRCPRLAGATPPVMSPAEVKEADLREVIAAKQTALPWGPRRLNLCYDRSCNLACPSCRSQPFRPSVEERRRVDLLNRRLRDELAVDARQLIISGTGDPFASAAYRQLLEDFDGTAWPQLESIHLHSNGLLWNASAWRAMQEARPFIRTAEISIDAASAATYALNRGGDFMQLLDNLAFLASQPVAITLSFVVQHNNYREMAEFVTLAQGFGFAVYFSQLVNWGTYRKKEFQRRAVHRPEHPEHREFCVRLAEVAHLPGVDVGNLRSLLAKGT